MKRLRNVEAEIKKPRIVLTHGAYQYTFGRLQGKYCNKRIPKYTKCCDCHHNNHNYYSNLKLHGECFEAKIIYTEQPISTNLIINNECYKSFFGDIINNISNNTNNILLNTRFINNTSNNIINITNNTFLNDNISYVKNIHINNIRNDDDVRIGNNNLNINVNMKYIPTTIKESFDSLMLVMLNNNKFGIFYSPLY